jgi:hypothetical protein
MAKVQLSGFRCDRCSHEWVPREAKKEPTVCPRCKSPYWNQPRRGSEAAQAKVASGKKEKRSVKK